MTAPAFPGFDRLVRKEVALGTIREMLPPEDHIGLTQIAPFLEVATDDVIFDYIKGGLQEGLAPARAEDAEAELAQKDEGAYVQGRASLIDWSLKDKYTASDVTRFRDGLLIAAQLGGMNGLSLARGFVGSTVADFQARVARHDALRSVKLNNRLEWLIMTALETNRISYNDGKIKFNVTYGRPTDQNNIVPQSVVSTGTTWDASTGTGTVGTNFDPIGDLLAVNQLMWDRYKVTLNRGIISRRILHWFWKSSRFLAAVAPLMGGLPSTAPIDLNYVAQGFGPQAALTIIENSTGIKFTVYDSVYRTRPIGSGNFTNNRFTSDYKILLLPDEAQLNQVDDTQIGFAKTLTSPHPEGNWQSGYYEWEDETRDPWMHVKGSGIKAFPVFPFMEYTATMSVLAATSTNGS